jgi:aerobic-type carbon monoxide dehydrogenase small subunit (CoxS/CutS family)
VEDEMAGELKIRVNERESTVTADLDTPLLYVLSNELGLQGPRFGCGLAMSMSLACSRSRSQPTSCCR